MPGGNYPIGNVSTNSNVISKSIMDRISVPREDKKAPDQKESVKEESSVVLKESKKVGKKPVESSLVDKKEVLKKTEDKPLSKGPDKTVSNGMKAFKKEYESLVKDYRDNEKTVSPSYKKDCLADCIELEKALNRLHIDLLKADQPEGSKGKSKMSPENRLLLQDIKSARDELLALKTEMEGDIYMDELHEGPAELEKKFDALTAPDFEGDKTAETAELGGEIMAKADYIRELVCQGAAANALANDPDLDPDKTLQNFRDNFPNVDLRGMDAKMRGDIAKLCETYGKYKALGDKLADADGVSLPDKTTHIKPGERGKMERMFKPILKPEVDIKNPDNRSDKTKKADEKKLKSYEKEQSAQKKLVSKEAKKSFAALTPEKLAGRKVQTLKGQKANLAMNEIAYQFGKSMKNDPKLRLMSSLHPETVDKQLNKYVSGLKLSSANKAILKKNMQAILEQNTVKQEDIKQGKKLGMGATGGVYEATLNGKPIAVKNPRNDNEIFKGVLNNEALLKNNNVGQVLGAYQDENGKLSVVMEKIDGFDIGGLAVGYKRNNPEDRQHRILYTQLTPEQRAKSAVHLIKGTINGLNSLHERGLAHVDLKPENIVLDKNSLEPKLVDFDSLVYGDLVEKKDMNVTTDYFTSGYIDNATKPRENDVYILGAMLADLTTSDLDQRADIYWEVEKKEKGEWLSPVHVPDKNLKGYDPKNNIWDENHPDHNQVKELKQAIDIISRENHHDRPTTRQLLDIVEGREPKVADWDESGIKEAEDFEILKLVLGPGGKYDGGRDVLADLVKEMEKQ